MKKSSVHSRGIIELVGLLFLDIISSIWVCTFFRQPFFSSGGVWGKGNSVLAVIEKSHMGLDFVCFGRRRRASRLTSLTPLTR